MPRAPVAEIPWELGVDVLEQERIFSYQVRIYDRSSDKVGEFASGIKNVNLVNFNFGYLRDGGCADFSFTLGDVSPFTIDYHYRVEFCFYDQPNPWYSGYVTKLPEKGTAKEQTYSGYGYRKQMDGIRINEVDTAEEVADIISDTIDDYIVTNTDIVKDTDKIATSIYAMVSTIYWDRIPASDLFERLRQLAGDYEWGVDEERDFYFRAIDTGIRENFWIGKHLDSFKGTEDPEPIKNRLYVKCGRLTDGSDYVLRVPDPATEPTASQTAFGLKEEVVVAPEFWPSFDATNLVTAIHGATNPVAGVPGNAIDGNVATYWDTGMAQTIGHYITVDLGAIYNEIARVVLDSTTALARDQFARGFDIQISTTGVFGGEQVTVFTSTILSTNNPDIRFSPTRGRYVRITLTIGDAEQWHLGEFEVYQLDTSDIERWANYILDQKDGIRKKASLTIKNVNELIGRKHVIVPFKPRGQWGIYDEGGNHIEDYPVISIKYSLSGDSFDMRAELGELERESIPAEFKRQLQRLEEYKMSGVRSSDDLASGIGNSPLSILRTMIGKEQIETPHLVAGSVTTDIIRAAAVIASKISVADLVDIVNLLTVAAGRITIGANVLGAGLDGILIVDGGAVRRVEIGEIAAGVYGANIRDAAGDLITDAGEVTERWRKIWETDIGVAVASVDLAGLDGNTDIEYRIITRWVSATITEWGLRFNDDAAANYGNQALWGFGAGAGAQRNLANNWQWWGETDTIGTLSHVEGSLYADTGHARTTICLASREVIGTSVLYGFLLHGVWNVAAGNLIKITFLATNGAGIGIGSHLEVWRRVG